MRVIAGDTGLMLFGFLVLHESEPKTLSEIATAINRAPQVVQSALRTLASEGVVLSAPKAEGAGRGALYRINPSHPIYPELRQIAIKLLGGSDLLARALLDNKSVEAAAIFGSMASGTDRRSGSLSDIDVLLIFADNSESEARFAARAAISKISEQINREINLETHTRSEWEAGKHTSRILRRIADGPKLILKGEF